MSALRLAVYSDHSYRRTAAGVYTDRAFILFLGGIARSVDRLVLAGQLRPDLPGAHYRVPEEIEFAPLPTYPSLMDPAAVPAMARSLRAFWRLLDEVDSVWLLGPHPLCLVFALLAWLRRRKVALGVRQDFPAYVRSRHPGRRAVHAAGDLLERAYRLLARRFPTVVVGPEIARHYGRARRLLAISVSLVREADVASAEEARARVRPEGPLTVLSVGRLETEKNPLMLADVAARLGAGWRLVVCGEGPLAGELRARADSFGVADRLTLRGYMPLDGGLMDLYRSADAVLHVSHTEGVPQILFEAFAAGTPVVATAVGGVAEAVGDAALLIPPADPDAAARALERLAEEPGLAWKLAERGLKRVRTRTLEFESARVAPFLKQENG